jgi:tetratricopeptide (TPR) repeat protein
MAYLLVDLGETQSRLSRYDDAVGSWKQSIDLLIEQENSDLAAELFARSGRVFWMAGNTNAGLAICREGLLAVESESEGSGLAHLLSETARACFFNGIQDEIVPYATRALEMAERFDLIAVRADTLIILGTSQGPESDEAIAFLKEAIQISESANLLTEGMRATNNLGVMLFGRGNLDLAMSNYRRAADLARQKGDLNLELFFSTNADRGLIPLGRLYEAELAIVELKKMRDELPDPGSGARSLQGMEAGLHWARGDFQQALKLWDRSVEEQQAANDLHNLRTSLGIKLLILQILGEHEQARELSMEAIEISLAYGRGVIEYSYASTIASQQENVQQAREFLDNAFEILGDEQPTFWRKMNILRAEALLHAALEEWDESWEEFSENQDYLNRKRTRWHAGWFKLEWADGHLLRGEPQDHSRARELLEDARAEFEDMSAPGWVELIDGKLVDFASSP